ncbi:ATP-dependent DNA helicase MER3, partial [Coemansia sp. S16]
MNTNRKRRSSQGSDDADLDMSDSKFFEEAQSFFARRRRLSATPMTTISASTATNVSTAAATGTTSKYFVSQQPRTHPLSTPSQVPQVSNNDARLIPVSALPLEFAATYSFAHFNRLQSACFADLFDSGDNLVISAPTTSGKTALMEIAMCRLFRDVASRGGKKALYLAPLKSLCAEKAA